MGGKRRIPRYAIPIIIIIMNRERSSLPKTEAVRLFADRCLLLTRPVMFDLLLRAIMNLVYPGIERSFQMAILQIPLSSFSNLNIALPVASIC